MSEHACRYCGSIGQQKVTICQSGPHYARVDCADCNTFIKWAPKPERSGLDGLVNKINQIAKATGVTPDDVLNDLYQALHKRGSA